jgi:hypothetical protein
MRYLLRAILELFVIAAILFALLLLYVSQLPDPRLHEPGAPLSPQQVRIFMRECDGRTAIIRKKLECLE